MKKLLLLLILLVTFTGFSQSSKEFALSAPEGMVLIPGNETEIVTNHPYLKDFVKEWESSVKAWNQPNQIDYQEIFKQIKSVQFRDLPLKDYWAVTKSGEIFINIRFIEYPHLARVMTYQAIGYIYGLEFIKEGRYFMSETWKPTPEFENWAYQHSKRFTQEKFYFEKLAKKYPLNFYHKI